ILRHAVFADKDHTRAKDVLAHVYERLGFGAENATWRNFYLQGAAELHTGHMGMPMMSTARSPEMLAALRVDQVFDSIAIQLDGPACWDDAFCIDWVFTDLGHTYRTELSHGALIQNVDPKTGVADLTLTLTKQQLLPVLSGAEISDIDIVGDRCVL